MENLNEQLNGKIVLITGGTGSFGNTVVKTLLDYSPQKIIIFSRDEKKQDDMRTDYNSPLLKFVIGDVRDKESVERVIEGVDYIFHAAALKQVPSCEFFPMEAVKTNIIGTSNVLSAAARNNVKRVVILSTDKAVYPINAMGMSKALMEKIIHPLRVGRGHFAESDMGMYCIREDLLSHTSFPLLKVVKN
jgi:UDP-N-acetylglucosamine 4,6-dehydratase